MPKTMNPCPKPKHKASNKIITVFKFSIHLNAKVGQMLFWIGLFPEITSPIGDVVLL